MYKHTKCTEKKRCELQMPNECEKRKKGKKNSSPKGIKSSHFFRLQLFDFSWIGKKIVFICTNECSMYRCCLNRLPKYLLLFFSSPLFFPSILVYFFSFRGDEKEKKIIKVWNKCFFRKRERKKNLHFLCVEFSTILN